MHDLSPSIHKPAPSPLTPFIIGITGHMRLPQEKIESLREKLRLFYCWLRAGEEEKFNDLGPGLGLAHTPIVILTSMAPGVDQVAAQVAREEAFGFRVVAPLPFPAEQYLRSTTFINASDEEKQALTSLAHESFYVQLADEVTLSKEVAQHQRESCLKGETEKPRRYSHLRASGEYVASYCDLLLAVTDHTHSTDTEEPPSFDRSHAYACGSIAIIRVRRHGVTHGLLPVEPALPWADAGPVVYLPWQKLGQSPPANEGVFTFYSSPGTPLVEDEAEREVLRETAVLISRFNQAAPTSDLAKAAEHQMSSMLAIGSMASLPEMPDSMRDRLLRVAGARNLARERNYTAGDEVEAWRDRFLTQGLVSAILLQMHDHWLPVAGLVPQWVGGFRAMAFIAALAFAGWSLFSLYRFRAGRSEQEQIDTRCIAEGLRVQFYWSAIGTGASAASNYLLRQRGAIRWIVNALSSASFPYESCSSDFHGMSLHARCELLRKALEGWLLAPGKKGQISYFREQLQKIGKERTLYRLQGFIFLSVGLLLSLLLFAFEFSPDPDLASQVAASSAFEGRFVLGILGLGALGWLGIWLSKWEPCLDGAIRSPNECSVLGQLLQKLVKHPPVMREAHSFLHLLAAAAALAVLIIGLVFLAALGLANLAGCLPSFTECLSMAKGIFFALSAVAFLASTLRFHTENARNYAAMLSLFESGAQRLKSHLGRLEKRCASLPPGATTDAQAERSIAVMQDLFLALGREALAEHAEWLHLHRDRPVSANLPNP